MWVEMAEMSTSLHCKENSDDLWKQWRIWSESSRVFSLLFEFFWKVFCRAEQKELLCTVGDKTVLGENERQESPITSAEN